MTNPFKGHDQGVRPHGTPSSGMPTPRTRRWAAPACTRSTIRSLGTASWRGRATCRLCSSPPDGHTELVDLPDRPSAWRPAVRMRRHRAAGRRHARSAHRRTCRKPSDGHRRRSPLCPHRTAPHSPGPGTANGTRHATGSSPDPCPRPSRTTPHCCFSESTPWPRVWWRRGTWPPTPEKWQERGRWPAFSWPRGELTKPRCSLSSSSSASWSPTRSAMAALRCVCGSSRSAASSSRSPTAGTPRPTFGGRPWKTRAAEVCSWSRS
jgi:hypothetical protein